MTTGGAPPWITAATVLTTVPRAARGGSQSRKAASNSGDVEYVSQALQILWKVSWIHPPPFCSAPVTIACRSASVHVDRIDDGLRVLKASTGGIFSAQVHWPEQVEFGLGMWPPWPRAEE